MNSKSGDSSDSEVIGCGSSNVADGETVIFGGFVDAMILKDECE